MATRISTSTVQSFLASDLSIMQFAILGALVVHTTDQANFSFPYSDIFEDINTLTPQAFVNRINLRFTNFAQIKYGLDVTNGAPLVFSLDNEGYLCQELAAGWSLAGYYTNLEYLTNIIDHIDILTSLGVTVNTTDVVNHGYSQTREELIFWVSPPGYNGFLDFILLQDGVEVGRVHQDAAIGDNVEIEVFCAKLKTSLEQAFTGQNISVNYTIGDINPQGKIGGIFNVKFAKEALYQAKIILVETAHGDTGEVNFPPQPYTTDNLRYPFWMDTARNYTIGSVDVQGVPMKFFRLRNNDITQTNHRVELIPVGNAKLTAKPNGDGNAELDQGVIINLNPGWGVCLSPLANPNICDCVSDTATRPIEPPLAPDSVVVFEAVCNGLFFSSSGSNNNDPDALVASLLAAAVTHNGGTQIYLSDLVDIIRDTANNQYIVKNKTSECLHDLNMKMVVWDHTGNNILGVEFFTPGLGADFTSLCPKYPDIVCAGAIDTVQFQTTLDAGDIKISVNDSPYYTANDDALSSLGISVSHYPMSLPGATCKIQVVGTGDKRLRIRVPDKYAALYANPDQGISQFDSNKAYAIFDANGSIIDPSHHSTDKSNNGSSFDDPSTPNDYYVWFNRMDVCLTKAADYTADDMVMITSDQVDTVTLNLVKGTSDVYWGDGNSDLGVRHEVTHTYNTRGNYTVVVRKASNEGGTNGNNTMTLIAAFGIQEVVQWWSQGYEALGFNLTTRDLQDTLVKVPTTAPLVFSTQCQIFMRCSVFNDPSVIGWDMSQYEDLNGLFYEAHAFNQPIGNWNVSNVTKMGSMFFNAHAFNQDIGAWNVSNVGNMRSMFYGCTVFDQDLSQWCVGLIASEPGSFRYGSPLTNAHCPVWGTCPRGW